MQGAFATPESSIPKRDVASAPTHEHEKLMRSFLEFLNSDRSKWETTLDREMANGSYRVEVQLADLRKMEEGLDSRVLQNPVKYLLPWEEALMTFLKDVNEKACKHMKQELKIDIQGSFGRNHITPRGLNSSGVYQLIKVEGIVTKAGVKAPKLLQSVHVHKDLEDGYVETRDHRDVTSFVQGRMSGAIPDQDKDGIALQMEVGLSTYRDTQRFHVQEAPENTPPGQIPRSAEVICEGDLCEKAKPGDRVQVTGVYVPFPRLHGDTTNGIWPSRIIATNVTMLKELIEAPFVSDDVKNIKSIAAREDAFTLLARSFAPSICGHEQVKAGLLLQMIGGTEKNLDNGTHLRGDINVLLVGDPSCGKSQMLRFVMNTSPLAISTTGRGSSGVGLTAAMVRDSTTREFTLEAGAMVLADRGVICIDEFDKMALNDRVAIHEAMEQQCVTIAKAGMHVTLNARCSVTAAANPKYGTFDPAESLAKNIGLPDSLLSRFDLIYIVRDAVSEEIDRKIADVVLRQHGAKFSSEGQKRGVEHMHSNILERRQEVDQRKSQEAVEVFVKGAVGPGGEHREVLTVDFLRKYIRYCKRFTPSLTEAAREAIAQKYSEMRMKFQTGFDDATSPDASLKPRLAVTTRTLEALIRLATAHAKLKLRREEVLPEDVDEAFRLMLLAREEEVATPAAAEAAAVAPEEAAAPALADGERGPKRRRIEGPDGEEGITAARLKSMQTLVARAFASLSSTVMHRGELLEKVNTGLTAAQTPFSEEELAAGLAKLEAQNKVLSVDDSVVLIG